MEKDEIRRIVVEALREMVERDEKGDIPAIDDRTDPIRHLDLQSEDGIEVACLLSEKLDFEIPHEVNPFTDDTRHRSRRVGEIVDLLCNLLGKKGVSDHA